MIKILFFIHDLGQGGAEKVLVNLVNNMNRELFDISVIALFGGGINEQFLKKDIHYHYIWKKAFPGNSKIMKLFSPEYLHKVCIREKYDIEVAYLEGPATRIISGCPYKSTKLVSWVHVEQHTERRAAASFRSINEIYTSYQRMDRIIAVSKTVRDDFKRIFSKIHLDVMVLYNTNESEKIKILSKEKINIFNQNEFNIISVGSLKSVKGFDRLLRIHVRLRKEGYNIHTYILGKGPQKSELELLIKENNMNDSFTLLGYNTNPYKYVSKADLFVCCSLREGFSTAATEALIVGTPVCTVEVSGMKEMLGQNNEYGIVVKNNENDLYKSIKKLYNNSRLLDYYKKQAEKRGVEFSTIKTVSAVEQMLLELVQNNK